MSSVRLSNMRPSAYHTSTVHISGAVAPTISTDSINSNGSTLYRGSARAKVGTKMITIFGTRAIVPQYRHQIYGLSFINGYINIVALHHYDSFITESLGNLSLGLVGILHGEYFSATYSFLIVLCYNILGALLNIRIMKTFPDREMSYYVVMINFLIISIVYAALENYVESHMDSYRILFLASSTGVMNHWFSLIDYELSLFATFDFVIRIIRYRRDPSTPEEAGKGFLMMLSISAYCVGAISAFVLVAVGRANIFPVIVVNSGMIVGHYYAHRLKMLYNNHENDDGNGGRDPIAETDAAPDSDVMMEKCSKNPLNEPTGTGANVMC
jgi:uncharacterized membrane protein YoaK (UPF0700 family)